ncbi:hypothetical protein HDU97_006205 [Phlyctochytrium planicorne]|nr:hypothetical protein HDU97_006205 [Phlyctochytrium planicorne]
MFFEALQKNDLQTAKSLLLALDSSQRLPQATPPSRHSDAPIKRHFKLSDLNKRDVNGNTPIHLAVSIKDEELLTLLLKLPSVDVNVQDEESGYTILHKALYQGDIHLALLALRLRSDIDFQIRDREGHSCFDLLTTSLNGATLPDRAQPLTQEDDDDEDSTSISNQQALESCLSSLWTWGKNSNYTLGSQNSDDRILPERLDSDFEASKMKTLASIMQPKPTVTCVGVSKYHMVFGCSNGMVFANGFGSGGRLGLGHEDTIVKPTPIQGIDGVPASVSLGPDHSLLVTKSGKVWSWGSNLYGQLGYNKSSQQSEIQLLPRKVTAFNNVGILGLAVTNSATAVLTTNCEIFVFSLFTMQKVSFSFDYFPKSMSVHRPMKVSPCRVQKLVSGNHQFAVITSYGDVFLWSPPEDKEFTDSWQHKTFPQSSPRRIWTPRIRSMAAKDISMGLDSTILLVTESGHCFLGARRPNAKVKCSSSDLKETVFFKFRQIPFLQNAVSAYASPVGSYAVLRNDHMSIGALSVPADMRDALKRLALFRDRDCHSSAFHHTTDVHLVSSQCDRVLPCHSFFLASRSPYLAEKLRVGTKAWKGDGIEITQNIDNSRRLFKVVLPDLKEEELIAILDTIYFGRSSLLNSFEFSHRGKRTHSVASLLERFGVSKYLKESEKISFATTLNSQPFQTLTDTTIRTSDGDLESYQALLIARCPFFEAMLDDDSRWLLKKEPRSDGTEVVVIDLQHYKKEVLVVVLKWIYGETSPKALFDSDKRKFTADSMVDFLVEILAASNELLLDELKEITSRVLFYHIDIRNVAYFLEVADTYEALTLKTSCMEFVIANVETAVETSILQSIPESIVTELEIIIKQKQEEISPYFRGENSLYNQIRLIAEEETKRKKQERRVNYEARVQELSSPKLAELPLAPEKSGVVAEPDDTVFELEMDEDDKPPIVKTNIKPELPSPSKTSPVNALNAKYGDLSRNLASKSWAAPSVIPKVSLATIMSEAEGSKSSNAKGKDIPRPPKVSPSIISTSPVSKNRSAEGSWPPPSRQPQPSKPMSLEAAQPMTLKISSGLSQRERRKSKNTAPEKTEPSPKTTPTKAWAIPSSTPVSSAKKSLRDVMDEESRLPASSPTPTTSFREIQEVQFKASLLRTQRLKKPLNQIQAEERAIKELQDFYRLTVPGDSGEWVSIRCVPKQK